MAGESPETLIGGLSSVYVELKPQLQVAQVSLNVPNLINCAVEVNQNGLQVYDSSCRVHSSLRLHDVHLLPQSCHGLRWVTGEGLHLRMQLSDEENNVEESSPRNPTSDLNRSQAFTCLCQRCGKVIFENRRFSQVLPLPSSNWEEMSDSWFCHRHDHNHEENSASCEPESLSLIHKSNDCLVSPRDLVVSSSVVNSSSIEMRSSGCVRCQRCRSQVGVVFKRCRHMSSQQSASLQFYRYAVTLQDITVPDKGGTKLQWEASSEQWLCQYLLEEARVNSSFRILVETDTQSGSPKPMALMWLLDSQVVLYHGSVSGGNQVCLHPEAIVKVMFKDCVEDDKQSLSSSWRKDFGVHCVRLPEIMCLQLLHLLIKNSRVMPMSLRIVNGFCISFLQKDLKQ